MPIYDYHCDHCAHPFSVVRSFKDDDVTVCPKCGEHPRRLLSKPAIVFKGSGWYITDSRSGPSSSSGDGGSTESKDTKESKDSKESGDKGNEKKESPKPASSSTTEKTQAPSGG